jgi:hypothetical protein
MFEFLCCFRTKAFQHCLYFSAKEHRKDKKEDLSSSHRILPIVGDTFMNYQGSVCLLLFWAEIAPGIKRIL